jgi:hypothetical protein
MISHQSFIAERDIGLCKSYSCKEKKKEYWKKWTSVQENKIMGTLMPA